MRQICHCLLVLMLLAGLTGCGGSTLRYHPDAQPKGGEVDADYTILQDRLEVTIDTHGDRVEDVYLQRPDGVLRPKSIAYPGFDRDRVGLGVGIPFTPIGVGLGPGVPVGDEKARGYTYASFDRLAAGPGPYRLVVKLVGVDAVIVPLPPWQGP